MSTRRADPGTWSLLARSLAAAGGMVGLAWLLLLLGVDRSRGFYLGAAAVLLQPVAVLVMLGGVVGTLLGGDEARGESPAWVLLLQLLVGAGLAWGAALAFIGLGFELAGH